MTPIDARHPTSRRPRGRPPAHPRAARDPPPADPPQRQAPASARTTPPPALRPQVREARPQPALALRTRDPRSHRSRSPRPRPNPRRPRRRNPRPKVTAASPCRRVCPASGSSTTSRSSSGSAPSVAAIARASVKRSASNSNTCRPRSSCSQHVRPKYACQACQANVVIARAAPRADREGAARPGTHGSCGRQQIRRSLAAVPPGRDLQAVRRRPVPLDDVRLDGRRRRPAGADRQGDAQAGAHVGGGPDRRHAGESAGPRRQGDQDRPALGPHRRPQPPLHRL